MRKKQNFSTTQDFTEITDVTSDGIVILKNGNACAIIEVSSINFYLLAKDEQDAKIYGYMAFLNSLNFPIQILSVSKKVNLSSYVAMLEQKEKQAKNKLFSESLKNYKELILHLLKDETHLDKKIYVVIPYSFLEQGAAAGIKGVKSDSFAKTASAALVSKRNLIINQFKRMGISARSLDQSQVVKLFYEMFNQEAPLYDFDLKDLKNKTI